MLIAHVIFCNSSPKLLKINLSELYFIGGTSSWQLPPTCYSECRWQLYEDEVQGVQKDAWGHATVVLSFELQPTPRRILHHHLPPLRESVSRVSSVDFESISGGPKGGHLKGEHLKMGFRTELRARRVDFALKVALDMSILTALATAMQQGKRRLDRESAVLMALCALKKCHFKMSWFKVWWFRAPQSWVDCQLSRLGGTAVGGWVCGVGCSKPMSLTYHMWRASFTIRIVLQWSWQQTVANPLWQVSCRTHVGSMCCVEHLSISAKPEDAVYTSHITGPIFMDGAWASSHGPQIQITRR